MQETPKKSQDVGEESEDQLEGEPPQAEEQPPEEVAEPGAEPGEEPAQAEEHPPEEVAEPGAEPGEEPAQAEEHPPEEVAEPGAKPGEEPAQAEEQPPEEVAEPGAEPGEELPASAGGAGEILTPAESLEEATVAPKKETPISDLTTGIAALDRILHTFNRRLGTYESTVTQIQQKIEKIEAHNETAQQDMLKGLNSIQTAFSDGMQNFSRRFQDQEGRLEDLIKSEETTVDERVKRALNVNREIEEERESMQESRSPSAPAVSKAMRKTRMPWYFNFLSDLVKGGGETKGGRFRTTFDFVERQLRSKWCTGNMGIHLITRLSNELIDDKDKKYEDIRSTLKVILERLHSEESQTLTEPTRNFVLNSLDEAEIIYHRINRHFVPITKAQIRKILDKILRRLKTAPYAIVLKDKIEFFRERLQDSNFLLDDPLFKQIRNVENELLVMGTDQLDSLEITKYETLILSWKQQIEKLLPETTLMILEPMLDWLQNIIQILQENSNAEVENEDFKIFFLLKQKEKEIKKYFTSDELLAQLNAFKKELEKNIYDKIDLKDAKRYYSLLLNWKKIILQAMNV